MPLHHIVCETPVGAFHMIALPNGTVRASGFGVLADLRARLPLHLAEEDVETVAAGHPYEGVVAAYFSGDHHALARIPREQEGTEFNHAVWNAMGTVGAGSVISYKELAAAAGNPAAVRAAGTICGRNRLILLVPCHRVVKSDGAIGSYLYGADIKKRLLEIEGAVQVSA